MKGNVNVYRSLYIYIYISVVQILINRRAMLKVSRIVFLGSDYSTSSSLSIYSTSVRSSCSYSAYFRLFPLERIVRVASVLERITMCATRNGHLLDPDWDSKQTNRTVSLVSLIQEKEVWLGHLLDYHPIRLLF